MYCFGVCCLLVFLPYTALHLFVRASINSSRNIVEPNPLSLLPGRRNLLKVTQEQPLYRDRKEFGCDKYT